MSPQDLGRSSSNSVVSITFAGSAGGRGVRLGLQDGPEGVLVTRARSVTATVSYEVSVWRVPRSLMTVRVSHAPAGATHLPQ